MQRPGGPGDIVALEHCGFAALPAERNVDDGPWVLRLAGGLAKRANSANPCAPGAGLDATRLARIEAFYRGAGLRPLLRITPLAAPQADALLEARGYRFLEDCRVMTMRLAPRDRPTPPPDGLTVTIETPIPAAWHDAFARFNALDAQGRATRRVMLDALDRPHAAVMLHDADGHVAGIGLAVLDGNHVGLFDVRVAAEARRRGLGRAVTGALLDWARAQPTDGTPLTAYLQVLADNAPARSLYRSIGFADAYAYHYRAAAT